MRAIWILALCCLAVLMVHAKKGKHNGLKWRHWHHSKNNLTKQPKENKNCTELPGRLLDWFHVLRTSHVKEEMFAKGLPLPKLGEVIPQMKPKEAKMPFPSGSKKQGCREPIRTVFRQLFDHNADGLVDETELADLYEAEPCMKQFFKTCSKGKETFTEPEFCSCFKSVEPPCFHKLRNNLPYLLVRGEPQPIAGAYTPSCDQDGYYLPRQCRTLDKDGNKECWCVDRHGSKIEGATECVDNTDPPAREEEQEEEP